METTLFLSSVRIFNANVHSEYGGPLKKEL